MNVAKWRVVCCSLFFYIFSPQLLAAECPAVFPDVISTHGKSENKSQIIFAEGAQVINNPDTELTTEKITAPSFQLIPTCVSEDCTASNSSAAISKPKFDKSKSKLDVTIVDGGSFTFGSGSDNEYREVAVNIIDTNADPKPVPNFATLNFSDNYDDYYIKRLNLGVNTTLNLAAGKSYFFEEFTIQEATTINVVGAGTAIVYVKKELTFPADTQVNSPIKASGDVTKLVMHVDDDVIFSTGVTFSGALYAKKDLTFTAASFLYGVASGEKVDIQLASTLTYDADVFNAEFGRVCDPEISAVNVIANYKFDESEYADLAGEVKDSIGTFHGRAVAAQTVAGKICQAVDLSSTGTGDYVVLDEAVLDEQSEFSISLWSKTAKTGAQSFLSGATKGSHNELLMWFTNEARFRPYLQNGQNGTLTLSPLSEIADDTWRHIVWTQGNDQSCLYIDTVSQGCLNQTTSELDIQSLILGQEQDSVGGGFDASQAYNGLLDELVIFDGVINQSKIEQIYNYQNNGLDLNGEAISCGNELIAQYSMEEMSWLGDTGEVIDETGNFNAQALNGANTDNNTPALTGNPGTCGYGTFDGVNDYIQIDDDPKLDLQTELTISVWINPTSLPSSGLKTIISKDENYEFHLQPSGEINWWWQTYSFSSSGAGITAGNWHHVAITYQSGEQVIYVNGVEKGARAFTGELIINSDPLQIGQDQGIASRFFAGYIDEVHIFNGALSAAEVNEVYAKRHPCAEPVIHHYEIVHDGNGLTCAAEPITIKACTNSDCSSLSGLSTEAVSLDFTVTSPTGGTLVKASPTFTGSTSFSFNHTSAENVTLSINGATISASHAIECSGAGNSCDISFADAGYIITLGDHKACTRPDLIIQAVKLADNGVSCAPAYIGDQAVDFTFNYSNPNTGTQLPLLNNMAMAANGIAQSRVVTFDANAKALLPFQYHDAGQINVAVKQGSGAGLASANVTALVTPDHIAIKAVDATASCTSADANDPSCHKFKVAGEDFAIEVGAYCADGSTLTPNFKLDDIVLSHNLIAPAGKALGKLGNKSIDIIDNGVAVISDQSISEVGVFTITATPPNGGYFGQTILPATSENMGRFVPDYFAVNTVFEGELLNVNGNSFAYTGEMNNANLANGAILYRPLMEPEILLTAKNIAGETTENYTDDFMKLSDSSFTITAPTTDTVQLGRDNLNKTQVAAGINILPENLTDKGNGTIEYQFNETDNFYYTRNENALVDSYPADIELHISAIADDDMVKAKYIDDLAVNGVVTLAPQGLDIRFGRWNIENTYGPETSNLVLPMSAQYWNGIKFVSNPLDNLTPYDGNLAGNYSKSNTGLSPQLNIGVVNVSGAGPFDLGLGQLLLSQPTNGAQGQIRITYETVPSWLKFNWNSVDEGSDGNIFDDNPSGVATFGRYRGNDRIISWREVSN